MWNGTMFVDLDWPLNASSLLSASAELLVNSTRGAQHFVLHLAGITLPLRWCFRSLVTYCYAQHTIAEKCFIIITQSYISLKMYVTSLWRQLLTCTILNLTRLQAVVVFPLGICSGRTWLQWWLMYDFFYSLCIFSSFLRVFLFYVFTLCCYMAY